MFELSRALQVLLDMRRLLEAGQIDDLRRKIDIEIRVCELTMEAEHNSGNS